MIVLALLAIVATLAGPSFSQYLGRQNLKGAVNESFSDLQYARSEAVQRNKPVTFTASGTGYTIVADPGVTNINIKTVTLATGNSISSGATMVATFAHSGTANVTDGPSMRTPERPSVGWMPPPWGGLRSARLMAPDHRLYDMPMMHRAPHGPAPRAERGSDRRSAGLAWPSACSACRRGFWPHSPAQIADAAGSDWSRICVPPPTSSP
jgi:type II secretory pathway pseudopilin PulG